ncbi:hypothetical protein [Paenibacillus sp. XY044]|uniref:hypothetical protein n=1 Tax=Paenibacillus sp. XY044 TaxID=2026089 RepID=UPI000B983107|nr:hypothetical protein [Paenibacillus sp. XY044]OZB98162.1 hypothetical protein CJP46_03055 [Paenibacillus sp. XY044]
MKLFRVKNKFSGYGLVTYVVYAKDESEAINLAGEKLREYALKTNYNVNEAAYAQVGIKVNNIFELIDTEDYHTYFSAKCLSEDIEEEQIVEMHYF